MSELLDPDGLIRRLKKGAPLMLEKETVRLPRFTEIREVDQSEIGGDGKETVVLARSRTATWALLPMSRKVSFGEKDARSFLTMMETIRQQAPQKPVRGFVLTSGTIKPEGASLMEEGGHLVTAIAE